MIVTILVAAWVVFALTFLLVPAAIALSRASQEEHRARNHRR